MIWMSWRQFRAQAGVAVAAMAVLALYLLVLGNDIHSAYHSTVAICHSHRGDCGSLLTQFESKYRSWLYLPEALLLVIPALLGAFWGAPLVARELEAGTHRLVWNQSVTRRRWLVAKLAVVCAAGAVVTGLVSAGLTWAASPVDRVSVDGRVTDPLAMGRFSTLLFGARGIAPVGYAVFAVLLGAIVGMALRRTVAAMAVTLVLFTVVQVMVPNLVRPRMLPPVTASQQVTAETIRNLNFIGTHASVKGVRVAGGTVISTSKLLTPDGSTLDDARYDGCFKAVDLAECLGALNLHIELRYQPDSRYWRFQALESALFLTMGVLLVGFGLWWIRRRAT